MGVVAVCTMYSAIRGRWLRDECLNAHEFLSLEHAKTVIEAWRADYNDHRPHGSLGMLTPSEYAKTQQVSLPEPTEF